MYRVSRLSNTVGWVARHIPKNQILLEKELKSLLRIAFWVAVIIPLILFPLYYLLVSLGL